MLCDINKMTSPALVYELNKCVTLPTLLKTFIRCDVNQENNMIIESQFRTFLQC